MRQFESRSLAMHLVSLVACAALCTAGCASSGRTLGTDPETWANSISVGDHLRVLTKSGIEKDVVVTAVDKSGISDNKEFIPYSHIQSIWVLPTSSASSGNTALIIVLTAVVVAALLSLVNSEIDKGFVHPAQ
jgi:hypothetical protein